MESLSKDTIACPSDTFTHVSGWLEGDYANNRVASDYVHSGTYAIKQVINNWGEAGVKKSFLYQDINVVPGLEYGFSAYGRKYDGSGNIMYLEAETFDSLHQLINTYKSDSIVSDSNMFLPLSMNFVTDAGSKFARFKLVIEGDTSWDRWDDVNITSSDSITSFDTLFVVNVDDPEVIIYDNPGGSVIDSAINGTRLVCNSFTNDNWYRVYLPGGTFSSGYGWIYGGDGINEQHLSGSQITNYVRCKTGALNIRKGPGTSYDIITNMVENQYFAFIDSSGYWYHIYIPTVNGETDGWASNNNNSYLDFYNGGPKLPYGANLDSMDYPSNIFMNDTASVYMLFKNIGNSSFDSSTILTISDPRYARGNFYDGSWIDTADVIGCTNNALPGQFTQITFKIRGNEVGIFTDYFNLREEGFCWFSDMGNIGPSDSAIAITVDVSTQGIHKEKVTRRAVKISYYNGFITVKNAKGMNLAIFNISGRKIFEDRVNENYKKKMDLRRGVYFVKVDRKGKGPVKKITVLE
ncbi:MAG: SH3 domain-containing protein [Proteobacteria bacterium]|nr:SH3 domain-containing protein [Pseudomonadota bacterium]